MLALALEVSTPAGSVALFDGDRILVHRHFDVGLEHSRRLMAEAAQLFELAGVGFSDLGGVAVTIGPGSFTGLRIGLSVAKGICYGRGLPLAGVPTLEAMAGRFPHAGMPVCPLLDARRGQVYTASFDTSNGAPTTSTAVRAISPEQFIEDYRDVEILLTGNGIETLPNSGADLVDAHIAPRHTWAPDAAAVGWLGQAMLARGDVLDVSAAEPEYVRVPEFQPAPAAPEHR